MQPNPDDEASRGIKGIFPYISQPKTQPRLHHRQMDAVRLCGMLPGQTNHQDQSGGDSLSADPYHCNVSGHWLVTSVVESESH